MTADGQDVVSHAGLALLRQLADKTGLTGELSRALASPRLLIHYRGRVTADLACAIADGAEVISAFRVLADQKDCPRADRSAAMFAPRLLVSPDLVHRACAAGPAPAR